MQFFFLKNNNNTIAEIQFSQCVSAIEGALPGVNSLYSHNNSIMGIITIIPNV